MQKLSNLKINSQAIIININDNGDKKIKQRLRDMGIIRGERLVIKKFAPLGDPIEIIIKGYSLSLRKKEAELIMVKDDLINE